MTSCDCTDASGGRSDANTGREVAELVETSGNCDVGEISQGARVLRSVHGKHWGDVIDNCEVDADPSGREKLNHHGT